MHNNMKTYATLIFLLLTFTAKAQTTSFVWVDEMCEYESIFDSTKTTRKQIKSAYSLVMWDEFRIHNTPSVHNLEDLQRLNIDTLENEYIDKKHKLVNLQLPDNKVWEVFRHEKLNEIEQLYKLSLITYKAYLTDEIEILNQFNKSDTCLTYYSSALINGGDSLLSAWEHLTKIQSEKNALPEKIWSKYFEQRNSENKFQYGKIQLLTFGWWNCAVKHIDYFDHQKAFKEFEKLFISTREIYCDEP